MCIAQDCLLNFQVSQYKIRFELITVQCPSAFDPAHFFGALKLLISFFLKAFYC